MLFKVLIINALIVFKALCTTVQSTLNGSTMYFEQSYKVL